MGGGNGSEWLRTLDEVERAVHGCLSALDRYEAKFGAVLSGAAVPVRVPADAPPAAPRWDDCLSAATGQADAVERLLAEQELLWGRWRESFANWRRSVEQPDPGINRAG